jgi:endoglucanase
VLLALFQVSAAQAPFSRGVNLTGWFQAAKPGEIQFTKFTHTDISQIKSLGCDVIRLPINLHSMTSGDPYYLVSPLFFSFLDSAVTWCEKEQVYLLIDDHTFDPSADTDPGIGTVLTKVWTQLAAHYKNRSKYVLYEVLNEPHGITTSAWGFIQQQVINVIRTEDTFHTIVVGGAGYNSYNELANLPAYADTNLLYTFHFYDPFLFTHQGATWASPSMADLAGVPFPYNALLMPACPASLMGSWVESSLKNSYSSEGNVAHIKQLIDIALKFRTDRKVRIFCGEFGVFIPNSGDDDRIRWYKAVRSYLESNNVPWTTWDYKGGFGLFKKGSGELFEHDLNTRLLDSLGLTIPPQTPFAVKPDSTGFMIYDDYTEAGISSGYYGSGSADFYSTNVPEAGSYCLGWSGFSQYNSLSFDFVPDRDFSRLVTENFALDLMVRGSKPDISFEIRFRDTKSGPDDHPWRMGTTVTDSKAAWDQKWHHLHIPLSQFTERGSWDNNLWYNPQGQFDWTKVDLLEISTEWTNIIGKHVWFDNIMITDLDTAVVRVTQPVGIGTIAKPGEGISIWPNPMKEVLNIEICYPPDEIREVSVSGLSGAKIATIETGNYQGYPDYLTWDGHDGNGAELAPGIYFIKVVFRSFSTIKRFIKL